VRSAHPTGPPMEGDPVIDRALIGTRLAPFTVEVDHGRAASFNEVFTDLTTEHAGGRRDLSVAPTFLFGLDLEDRSDVLTGMGIDPHRVLHVEQGFVYHRTARVGERLTFSPVISDVHVRGGLEFVARDTAVTDAGGEPVADLHQVIAVRPLAVGEARA